MNLILTDGPEIDIMLRVKWDDYLSVYSYVRRQVSGVSRIRFIVQSDVCRRLDRRDLIELWEDMSR